MVRITGKGIYMTDMQPPPQDYGSIYAAPPAPPAPSLERTDWERDVTAFTQRNASYYLHNWRDDPAHKRMGWNWPGFLVSVYWLAYRKLYVHLLIFYGIALAAGLLISLLLIFIAPQLAPLQDALTRGVSFGVKMVTGLYANKWLYNRFAKRREEASAMPLEERLDYLRKKGGVSVLAVIACIVLEILFAVWTYI